MTLMRTSPQLPAQVPPPETESLSSTQWLLMALPVLAYFAGYALLTQNLPRNDDPPATLPILLAFHDGHDWLRVLFEQYVEHRIAYPRLMTLLVQQAGGALDYRWLGFVGNLSLLGTLLVCWSWFRRWGLRAYFLPVPFILFQFGYHHNTFVAMMALQNLSIVCWALLTCWWLGGDRPWQRYAALATALLATFTSGNGGLLFPIGIGFWLLQRRWTAALLWAVVGGLALGFYFWQRESIAHGDRLALLPTMMGFLVFFCGSYFDVLPNVLRSTAEGGNAGLQALFALRMALAFGGGLLVLAGVGYLLFSWLRQPGRTAGKLLAQTPLTFLALGLLFLLGTALIVTQGRADGGLSQSFAVRYKIYSPLFVILLYAGALWRWPRYRRGLLRGTLAVSVVLGASSFFQNLNQISQQNTRPRTGWYNFTHNGTWAVDGRFYGDVDTLLRGAVRRGLFGPGPDLLTPFADVRPVADTLPHWPVLVQREGTGWQVRSDRGGGTSLFDEASAGAYVVISRDTTRFLLPTEPNRRALGTYAPGFRGYIDPTSPDIPPGTYRVGIYQLGAGTRRLYQTRYSVVVPPK
jgi:hypothetical protein